MSFDVVTPPQSPPNWFRGFGITIGQLAAQTLNALRLKFSNGSYTAPSVTFQGSPFDGLFWYSAGHVVATAQGNPSVDLSFGIGVRGDATFRFSPTGDLLGAITGNTMDASFYRTADGVIRFGRGDLGANGSIAIGDPGYARPAAAAGLRGMIWIEFKGAGVADTVAICVKNAADAYVWQTLI